MERSPSEQLSRGQEIPSLGESTVHGQCHCKLAAFCCLLAIIAAMALSAALFVFFKADKSYPDLLAAISCSRPGCIEYATLLRNTLNMSVDPCHDFGAFVASRWLPGPSTAGRLSYRLQWDVRVDWACRLAKGIRERQFSAPLMDVVASSLAACEHPPEADGASRARTTLKEHMRNLSVPWPEVPPRDVDPLNVLLELCVTWQLPLWFDVKMLPSIGNVSDKRNALYVAPTSYARSWDGLYREISDAAAENSYIEPFVEAFSDPAGRNVERVDYRKVYNTTTRVVSTLARVCAERHSIALTLDAFADRLGAAPDRLAGILNHQFRRSNESFLRKDVVVVKSRRVVDVVRQTLTACDTPAILSHLGWWLLQIYAPLADQSFFTHKYGGINIGLEARIPFCGSEAEQTFKLLLLSEVVSRDFPARTRQDLDRLLDSVRQAVDNIVENSPQISPTGKSLVPDKLRNLQVNLWPRSENVFGGMARAVYYVRRDAANATDALDHWIAVRRASAELVGSPAYFEDVRLPRSHDNDLLSYDTFLNSVSLSLLTALPPFYYPDGSLAVNYGGLGAAFSVTLVRGLSAAAEDLMKVGNGTCGQATPRDRWQFLPALNAFRERQKNESLEEIAGFEGEALFFISYCHTQCRLDASFNCTEQLSGLLSFAEAFRCARGSRMAISEEIGSYVAL